MIKIELRFEVNSAEQFGTIIITGLVYLFIAYVLKFIYSEEQVKIKNIIVMMVMAMMMTVMMVMAVLLFFCFYLF